MQNAVIYARYSSHGQNEQTIDGQIRVCREYAKQHKLNIIGIYTDKHRTGTDVNRPQFQKMIADSASGTFQYVIVYMIDRFARNRYYSTMYNFQLASNSVKLVSATENISESEEGEFYQMFLEWNAERYSKRLSKRVIEGITTSVNNGTFTGGYLIMGYKKDGKKLVVDEPNADIVRYIFKEYANGKSKKEIAEDLNAQGKRKDGKLWKGRDFDRILNNKKYTGVYTVGGRVCSHTYPKIVDDVTFDKVQERAKKNKSVSGANTARIDYLLQGKAFCGHCGASLIADGGTNKVGKKYHYYACGNHKKLNSCDKKNEKKEFLEWYVVEQVVNYLSDPQRVKVIADDIVKYYSDRTSEKEIRRLSNERAKVQKEIDNAVALMVSGVSTTAIKALDTKIIEMTALLNDLTEHQAKLELERGLALSQQDVITFVAEFIKGNLHDASFQKRIIDNLVNVVYVSDDRITIYFNINNGCEVAYIGKEDNDTAIDGLFNNLPNNGDFALKTTKKGVAKRLDSVQTLTHPLCQRY